jgi:hypothetical protein
LSFGGNLAARRFGTFATLSANKRTQSAKLNPLHSLTKACASPEAFFRKLFAVGREA